MPPLESIREALSALPGVRLAAAFGSVARGEERARSDLDIGLLLDPDTPELRREVEAALGESAGRELDPVYLDAAPPLLRFEIARDGVLLLERCPYEWADFRARAMIDWWDWAPTARIITDAAILRLREKVGTPDGTS